MAAPRWAYQAARVAPQAHRRPAYCTNTNVLTRQLTHQALLVKFIDGRVTVADPTNGVCGCAKESIDFTDTWKAKVSIVSGAIVSGAIASVAIASVAMASVAIVSVAIATVAIASVAIASVAIAIVAIVSADAWKVKVVAALLRVHRICTACTLHIMSLTT